MEPPVDLASERLRGLARSVIPRGINQPFGAYCFGPFDPAAELARAVESAVLLEAFGNTPETIRAEYGEYEASSLFFCILDHRREVPAGAVRIVLPTEGGPGMKTVNDLPRNWHETVEDYLARHVLPGDLAHTWDIATLAVAPEYRSAFATGLVAMGLYQSGLRTAVELGFEWMVAILDKVVYRMAKARFRQPFVPFAEARPYLGSQESLPVYLSITDYRRRLSLDDPPMHAILFEGVGIEPALAPLSPLAAATTARKLGGYVELRPTEDLTSIDFERLRAAVEEAPPRPSRLQSPRATSA
jgi:hypothetical protein